jgi:hypothetical protein
MLIEVFYRGRPEDQAGAHAAEKAKEGRGLPAAQMAFIYS